MIGSLVMLNAVGWYAYYRYPEAERLRLPMSVYFKPSGYVGQSAGVLALLIFVFLWLYPLRKRFRQLAWTGTMAKWLDIHILTALGMPLLLTLHAAWNFRGLIGLGFWSMMIVVASGIVGRYLYMRIPRSQAGVALTKEEVAKRRADILQQIADALQQDVASIEKSLAIGVTPPARQSLWVSFMMLVMADFQRWRMSRELRRRWKAMLRNSSFSFRVQRQKRVASERAALGKAVRLANKEMALEQQAKMLDATNSVFSFWHVAHRPFAVTAGIAVIVHVAVVIVVGVTWFH
jgi:hypothetical protein